MTFVFTQFSCANFFMEKIKKLYRLVIPQKIRSFIKKRRLEIEFHYDAEIEFYGAYKILKKYVGIKHLNYEKRKKINWAHGWYADFFIEKSEEPYMACCNIKYRDSFNFVTRKTQEKFLWDKGFPNSKAIGMPIIYLPEKKYQKLPNSLLVMPGHSLPGYEMETFEDEYVNSINSFRHEFEKITICIHPGCFYNGLWHKTFKKHGYNITKGVELCDLNAFPKLQKLMSEHEYMTTNSYGSHVMYASYFGSKVSIIGKVPDYKLENLLKNETWISEKNKKPIIEEFNTVTIMNYRKYYPSFFVEHPLEAISHKELADYELGVKHKINKLEFDQIVGNIIGD